MDTELRVLIVDDSESDSLLVLRDLERAGYRPFHIRAETAAEMKDALRKHEWDIIISDYNMPGFNAISALKLLQDSGRDIPFIVLSGTMGEDTAVAMMKAGAHDYVMKNNRMRLIPAVERELRDAETRRDCKRAEEALRQSEERYRILYEDNPSMYFTLDADFTVLSINRYGAEQLGCSREELVGQPVLSVFYRDDREAVRRQLMKCLQDPTQIAHCEFRKIRKDGSIFWVKESARAVRGVDGNTMILVACEDITERKEIEEALKKREDDLQDKTSKLEDLNATLKVLLEQREKDRDDLEKWVRANVENLLMPYIEKLKMVISDKKAETYISMIETSIKNITSSFSRRLSSKNINLSSKELQVANLVMEGKCSKDISELLNITERTVDYHRRNIRVKLGLTDKKADLRSFLLNLS